MRAVGPPRVYGRGGQRTDGVAPCLIRDARDPEGARVYRDVTQVRDLVRGNEIAVGRPAARGGHLPLRDHGSVLGAVPPESSEAAK